MSTLMEDRLATALRARAEQVQPEDLTPVAVPAVTLEERRARVARRRRTAVLTGVAAAAVAAAVAGPLVLTGPDGTGSPQPAGPSDPASTSSTDRAAGVLVADVDGDGQDDEIRLHGPQGESYEVRVTFDGGDQAGLDLTFGPALRLWTTEDLDGDGSEEILLRATDEHAFLPLVIRSTESGELALANFPMAELQGWTPDSSRNRWAVLDDRLRTYRPPAAGGTEVPVWSWRLEGQQLGLDGKEIWCLADPADEPAPCPGGTDQRDSSDGAGAHSDLPELMPAVTEVLRQQPYRYGTGPVADDYAQLQGDLGEDGGAVAGGQVELVVTALGEEHRVPIPAGQSPRLVPQSLGLWGDAPAFLVQRSGGDTAVVELYSFWNGELVALEPEADVFLGSGIVDHRGEMTEQRTWITPEGTMFTAVLLDYASGRHQLWQWDPDAGETISTIDLGEACIDWETGEYGRC